MKKAWATSPTCIERTKDMLIHHPLLGPRDASEFVYKGDAALIHRPDWQSEDA